MKRYRCQNVQELARLLKQHHEARVDAVRKGAALAARRAVPRVQARTPKAFETLRDGIDVEVVGGKIRIVASAPHAGPVEVGARPHMPPLEPLIAWCELRGFEDPRGAAWAIAQKIAREGIEPTHFMQNSVPDVLEELDRAIAEALAAAP